MIKIAIVHKPTCPNIECGVRDKQGKCYLTKFKDKELFVFLYNYVFQLLSMDEYVTDSFRLLCDRFNGLRWSKLRFLINADLNSSVVVTHTIKWVIQMILIYCSAHTNRVFELVGLTLWNNERSFVVADLLVYNGCSY